MCGRYAITPDAAALLAVFEIFGDIIRDEIMQTPPQTDVRPTQTQPIIVQLPGDTISVQHMRWGFVPVWWKEPQPPKSTINARIEEAPSKPMWRTPLTNSRCLVPISAWYEWQETERGKIKRRIELPSKAMALCAGLWSPTGSATGSFTIMTTAAAECIADIHIRMPVVLTPSAWRDWLSTPHLSAKDAAAFANLHTIQDLRAD